MHYAVLVRDRSNVQVRDSEQFLTGNRIKERVVISPRFFYSVHVYDDGKAIDRFDDSFIRLLSRWKARLYSFAAPLYSLADLESLFRSDHPPHVLLDTLKLLGDGLKFGLKFFV
jgi:superfamily I DNA/RNA helicase